MTQALRDDARLWRSPLLPDAELLTAEYYAQEFAPHWHEGFSIPVILRGAQTYRYRGALCLAGVGSIAAINPGEIHTGERATDTGWAYRAFYPSVAWMQALASDIAGRTVDVPWLPDGAIADAEVAAKLAFAHRLLENGADALAAECGLYQVRGNGSSPELPRSSPPRGATLHGSSGNCPWSRGVRHVTHHSVQSDLKRLEIHPQTHRI